MPRVAYVNGRFEALAEARVSIEDRGYQFADGVYEVCALLNGRLLDWDAHRARLHRSLDELAIPAPMSDAALTQVVHRLARANRVADGLLYIQVTRGVAKRDHSFPHGIRPSLVMTLRPFDYMQRVRQQQSGVTIVSAPDERWARCDIKSISLLPNVLAKQLARDKGAFEVWLVAGDGTITEGSSTNAWIVTKDGSIVTRPLSRAILNGVTRTVLIAQAQALGLRVEERAFTAKDVSAAAEAFLTSTTALCLPVVRFDDQPINGGLVGPVTATLARALWAEVERQTGWRVRD